MVYVQEVNYLSTSIRDGIYMYNHGHSATYKYRGTAQYKIYLNMK